MLLAQTPSFFVVPNRYTRGFDTLYSLLQAAARRHGSSDEFFTLLFIVKDGEAGGFLQRGELLVAEALLDLPPDGRGLEPGALLCSRHD